MVHDFTSDIHRVDCIFSNIDSFLQNSLIRFLNLISVFVSMCVRYIFLATNTNHSCIPYMQCR